MDKEEFKNIVKNKKSLNIPGRTFIILLYRLKRLEIRVEYLKKFLNYLLLNNPYLRSYNLDLKRIY